jgi:hypothetical protein
VNYISEDDMTEQELRDQRDELREVGRQERNVRPPLADVLAAAIRDINYARRLAAFFGDDLS